MNITPPNAMQSAGVMIQLHQARPQEVKRPLCIKTGDKTDGNGNTFRNRPIC